MDAMLDTGSSVSITDEELFVAFATKAHLPPSLVKKPEAILRNYSDGRIHVVACVELRLTAGGKQMSEVVYVVSDAKPQCLIGINVVKGLGLAAFPKTVKFLPLQSQKDREQTITSGVVHLVSAVTVPGQRYMTVHGTVD